MAVTNGKKNGLNNQKRGVCVMVSDELSTTDLASDGTTIATLPDKAAVIQIYLIVTAASAASDTIDVNYAGSEIGSEIAASALGVIPEVPTAANAYSATGGDIVAKDGSQAVDSTFRGRLVVEYIELDKTIGEYTN